MSAISQRNKKAKCQLWHQQLHTGKVRLIFHGERNLLDKLGSLSGVLVILIITKEEVPCLKQNNKIKITFIHSL